MSIVILTGWAEIGIEMVKSRVPNKAKRHLLAEQRCFHRFSTTDRPILIANLSAISCDILLRGVH